MTIKKTNTSTKKPDYILDAEYSAQTHYIDLDLTSHDVYNLMMVNKDAKGQIYKVNVPDGTSTSDVFMLSIWLISNNCTWEICGKITQTIQTIIPYDSTHQGTAYKYEWDGNMWKITDLGKIHTFGLLDDTDHIKQSRLPSQLLQWDTNKIITVDGKTQKPLGVNFKTIIDTDGDQSLSSHSWYMLHYINNDNQQHHLSFADGISTDDYFYTVFIEDSGNGQFILKGKFGLGSNTNYPITDADFGKILRWEWDGSLWVKRQQGYLDYTDKIFKQKTKSIIGNVITKTPNGFADIDGNSVSLGSVSGDAIIYKKDSFTAQKDKTYSLKSIVNSKQTLTMPSNPSNGDTFKIVLFNWSAGTPWTIDTGSVGYDITINNRGFNGYLKTGLYDIKLSDHSNYFIEFEYLSNYFYDTAKPAWIFKIRENVTSTTYKYIYGNPTYAKINSTVIVDRNYSDTLYIGDISNVRGEFVRIYIKNIGPGKSLTVKYGTKFSNSKIYTSTDIGKTIVWVNNGHSDSWAIEELTTGVDNILESGKSTINKKYQNPNTAYINGTKIIDKDNTEIGDFAKGSTNKGSTKWTLIYGNADGSTYSGGTSTLTASKKWSNFDAIYLETVELTGSTPYTAYNRETMIIYNNKSRPLNNGIVGNNTWAFDSFGRGTEFDFYSNRANAFYNVLNEYQVYTERSISRIYGINY